MGLLRGEEEARAPAVKVFYKRNDSALFGEFAVATQPLARPVKPLHTEDIRKVLSALPLAVGTPLLRMNAEFDDVQLASSGSLDPCFPVTYASINTTPQPL